MFELKRGIALVFPGQGSQYVGMGRDLFENYSKVKELFLRADKILGTDLKDLCFNGPDEKLIITINAQPAIFLVSMAALTLLKNEGIEPEVVAGHSLGEYSALAAAEVFDFNGGLRLVKKRAELMRKMSDTSNAGEMIAVLGLEEEKVNRVVESLRNDGIITIANYNCPGQVVISGESKVINLSIEHFNKAGAKRVVKLAVSGGFHSPLMKKAEDELSLFLSEIPFKKAIYPIVSNYTAEVSMDPDLIKNALKNQIAGSVKWQQSVEKMLEIADIFIEIGPGKVLSGLIKRISPKSTVLNVEDSKSFENTINYLREVA
ncbi:MAG: ACP S-malonyltransferase [Candidatus Subteraquimicrobiales bacterium]|nr:ACP S-malonyltransferase [Candidatus Subteraquimicrobiales bacterium]